MCGIIGAKIKNKTSFLFLCKCMDFLTIRGTHAFGYASYSNGVYNLCKEFDLERLKENLNKIYLENMFIVFHNRYSTSGNWLSHSNNMPIGNDSDGYIVLNGVLEQSTPLHWKNIYGVDCKTLNDVLILFNLIKDGGEPILILLKHPKWSVASIILDKQTIIGFRNNKRPLYKYLDLNILMLISTIDSIVRYDKSLINNIRIVPSMELECII